MLSADAFGAFEEAGLDNEAAVRATGRRFRDTVLALGGSRHPMEVFRAFRGREPIAGAAAAAERVGVRGADRVGLRPKAAGRSTPMVDATRIGHVAETFRGPRMTSRAVPSIRVFTVAKVVLDNGTAAS